MNEMKANRGFTLIEVLVASLILFLAITALMTIYQGAIYSATKSSLSIALIEHVDEVKSQINQELFNRELQEEIIAAGYLHEIKFDWTAKLVAKARSYHPDNKSFDSALGENVSESTEVYLWEITVNMSKEDKVREFSYWEMTW